MTTDANQAYLIGTDDILICTNVNACELVSISNILNKYYVKSDEPSKVLTYKTDEIVEISDITTYPYFVFTMDDNDGLIDCSSEEGCSVRKVIPNDAIDYNGIYASEGYYLGGEYDTTNSNVIHAIILCSSDYGCKVEYKESSDPQDNSYFLNAGFKKTTKPIIKYSSTNKYEEIEIENDNVYYINSGASTSKPLIYCNEKTSCDEVGADENNHYVSFDSHLIIYDSSVWKVDDTMTGYYLNGGADKYRYPLIYCSVDNTGKNTCSTIEVTSGDYYTYKNTNSLISCTSEHSCVIIENVEEGYYVNSQEDATSKPIIRCSDILCKSIEANVGYFLDQATYTNNKYYSLIYCSSTTLCSAMKSSPGFYINANNEDGDEVIECQTSCISKPANVCNIVSEKVIIPAGSYCFSSSKIQFVIKPFELNETRTELDEEEIDTYMVISGSDPDQENYVYTTVNADIFPGITSSLSTLFKISHASITLVIEDGIIAINTRTNERIMNYAESISLNSRISFYNCNSFIPSCIPVNSCTKEMYIYDASNHKGLYCNNSELNSITVAGYYLDGSRSVNGKYPYVLDCDDNGRCNSITPNNIYMLNEGYDNSSNKLISCQSNDCKTIEANVGYYLDYKRTGVIYCSSSTKCSFIAVNSFRYYLNAGANTTSKQIIQCYSGNCNAITPTIGYYITYSPSILINCVSRLECAEIPATEGYYFSSYKGTINTKYIIHCINNNDNISCGLEATSKGAYVSNEAKSLVICDENECKAIQAGVGVYISAGSTPGKKIKRSDDDIDIFLPGEEEQHYIQKRENIHNIIICDQESCRELSAAELALIPICSFNNDLCYITSVYASQTGATTTLTTGGYCTNLERSKLYFATGTIIVESNNTENNNNSAMNTNCIEVSKAYKNYYFTSGSNIYHLDDSRVTLMVNTGYYFINIISNTLANGINIDEYNDKRTKIFKCNGQSCSVVDNLTTDTYIADINKKIIKYSSDTKKFSFPYTKDIICIYGGNHCTPKYDLVKQEFCITYKGELVLTSGNIPSRESALCYRSNSIDTNIYGHSEFLYQMDRFSAKMIDHTSYRIISKSTNYTADYKDYTIKPKNIVIYGCVKKRCDIYSPKENIYYYDDSVNTMYRLVNGVWEAPQKSGYAYISVNPTDFYIYKFSIINNAIKLESRVNIGFYYTIDKEMYECSNNGCRHISDSGYVFTNNGEIYYCEYDSEELEETVCKIQSCVLGQYYFIDGYYYRCESGNILNLMNSKNCVYSARYIINFPTILSNDYPSKVRYAVEKIAKNNHSTATYKKGRNYLPVVPAVYTNCTYNFEDHEPTFDLVCVNNYVTLNKVDESEICSVSNMGYVYCADDSDNPDKCNPSAAHQSIKISFTFLLLTIITSFFFLHL
ncbi:hypothetical protein BCR36DRAFT_585567 [Piromyces finnis]|uniref:Scaffoldin n=1 Tax=Piromyces finnis TaxID=1754191 RepID=A0A1Y1V2J0_9FUNG|nr:hypothetical protein BCR36DRAFT_585567 [Piromyces finnis]|eukprot:ORX45813.1 hypothetical protein BCR36DRAFT_585567 [Piromyces finnis]